MDINVKQKLSLGELERIRTEIYEQIINKNAEIEEKEREKLGKIGQERINIEAEIEIKRKELNDLNDEYSSLW